MPGAHERCVHEDVESESMNTVAIAVFAPILVVVGVLGFVIPADKAATSGAPAYNVFHIVFGVIGIALALSGHDASIRTFNIGFGAIDLYQAFASRRHWWPERLFRWTKVDDWLHVVIGVALVAIGVFG
jgi:hypothetical protein